MGARMNGVVMPRNRNLPKYEKRSDRDVGFCRYYTADGKRRKKYFPGAFRSAESKAAYGQFIKEISQSLTPGLVPTTETGSRYRVAELAALWLDHCSKLYDREAETKRCAKAVQPVIDLCHDCFCDDFGPKDLKRCRSELIRMGNSRKTIKDKINRIVQMFRYGAEEELCSETIYMKKLIFGALFFTQTLSLFSANLNNVSRVQPKISCKISSSLSETLVTNSLYDSIKSSLTEPEPNTY